MASTTHVPRLVLRPLASHREALGWAFALSVFVHLAIVWRLTFAGGEWLASRGEDGDLGAGGVTFVVSVEGPESETPLPVGAAPTPDATPTPEAAITPPPAAPAPSALTTDETAPSSRAAMRPSRAVDDTATATAEPVPVAPAPSAGAPSDPIGGTAGTGASMTDEGRLRGHDDARLRALLAGSVGGTLGGSSLGDVALLTEASRCPDPIAGTWTAHRYSPEFRDWAWFTLSITRDGDRLSGTIRTRMWRGLASDRRPPACTPGGWDYTVEQSAIGSVSGTHFDFGSREHHIAHVECASPTFGYNPDHFTGHYDEGTERLLTVNNDGGRDVNAAYQFRRTSCQP
jgi:hypothetical protein